MKRKTVSLVTILLVIAIAFSWGCTPKETGGADQEKDLGPIKVGAIWPMSGTCAKPGTGCANAIELALAEVNANGGVYGRQLELIVEDDEGQPAVSVAAAEKLCVQDEVAVVIGAFNSSCVLAHMQVTAREGVPQIDPVAFASGITRPMQPYMFRNVPQASLLGVGIGDFFIQQTGGNKFAIIRENTDYGLDYEKFIGEYMKEQGKEIAAIESYNPGDTDFYAQLTKIKSLKVDGIVMIANMAEGAQLVKQIKELNIGVPVFGSGSNATQQFYDLAGSAADEMYTLSFLEYTTPDPIVKNFVDSYKSKYGYEPDMFAAAAYDAVLILKAGLENAYKANGEKWPEDLKVLRDAIRDGIDAVDNIEGAQGKIKFNEYNEAPCNNYWVQWKPGGVKEVVSITTAEDFHRLEAESKK